MAGPVLDEADQAFGAIHQAQNGAHHIQISTFRSAAEVVYAAGPSLFQGQQNAPAVILHVYPIPDVGPRPVHGQGLALAGAGNHKRNEFFRKLIRAVIVGAAGDDRVLPESDVGGADQQIRRGLGGRIGAVGGQGRVLAERALRAQAAVHLVGGHVHEARHARPAGGVQQNLGSHHIGGHKGRGVGDGAIHMTFGRKMDHGVERAGREQLADKGGVGYIALDEAVAGGPVRRQIGQIGGVARIGQLVQIDHPRIGALGQDQPDEIGADEAAASGDQKRHDALMVRLVE